MTTVTTTVATMTALDMLADGCTSARSEPQSNVETDTITMMATSAATGTCDTQGFNSTMRISRNTPANSVDSRPRPPYRTLLTVWPIMPQPAMPPKRLAATLARPRPLHSRFLALGVSVSSSTTLAVIIDSSKPTIAMAKRGQGDEASVSSENGTGGSAKTGNASGSRPRSATVFSGRCSHCATSVSTTMHISGDGMAVVIRGRR